MEHTAEFDRTRNLRHTREKQMRTGRRIPAVKSIITLWTRCPVTPPVLDVCAWSRSLSSHRSDFSLGGGEPTDRLNELPKSRCANDRLLMPRAETPPCLWEPVEAYRMRQRQALPKSRHLDRVSSLLRAGVLGRWCLAKQATQLRLEPERVGVG